jgi:AcrR family transcriptional regulator
MEPAVALTPRQIRREERLAAWTDAALALLSEGGLDRVTIKALAARVGKTASALYRSFPSKDALLAAMQDRVLQALRADVEASLAAVPADGSPTTALRRLLACVDAFVALPDARPAHFQLLTAVQADPRPLLDGPEVAVVADALRPLLGRIVVELLEAEATGALEPGDARQRTLMLWSSLQGLLQIRKFARWDAGLAIPPALPHDLACSLLVGWGADAATLAAVRES